MQKKKVKLHCFFIFSSCNWTCMQLTLQWPGSFCIVCLLYFIYYNSARKLYTRLHCNPPEIMWSVSTDINNENQLWTLPFMLHMLSLFNKIVHIFPSSYRVLTTKPFAKYLRLYPTGPSMAYGKKFSGCFYICWSEI